MFYSYGEGGEGGQYYDAHSIEDLHHNQSLLAYEMNGEPLPVLHGAPLRLRVENQLGFKQVKWIREIELSATSPSAARARAATTRTTSSTATATRSNAEHQGITPRGSSEADRSSNVVPRASAHWRALSGISRPAQQIRDLTGVSRSQAGY